MGRSVHQGLGAEHLVGRGQPSPNAAGADSVWTHSPTRARRIDSAKSKRFHLPARDRRLQNLCAVSHSRRAEFTRVCQPRPRLLKARTMSASSRMFTCCFGVSRTGRPRFGLSISLAASAPTKCGSTSDAGRARANQSVPNSGASSSTSSGFGLRGIFDPLAVVGPSKADHMQCRWSWRENEHVKSLTYQSQYMEASLTVVLSRVFSHERRTPVQLERKAERNTPLSYVPRVLLRVKSHQHAFYCTHTNTRIATKAPNPSTRTSPQVKAVLVLAVPPWKTAVEREHARGIRPHGARDYSSRARSRCRVGVSCAL